MAVLYKKLLHQTKSDPSLLNQTRLTNNKGFVSLLFLPLIALMFTAFIGLSSLSLGIKNITQAQSSCIEINMRGQNKLKSLLEQIIKLNQKVIFLHKTRQSLKTSLATAIALGQIELIPPLRKALKTVEQGQKFLTFRQKQILTQSQLVKRNTFQKLKRKLKKLSIHQIRETGFYKKALALNKEKIGDRAYTYKPMSDFTEYQKSQFIWEMQPFFPLYDKSPIIGQKKLFSYKCTASLQKKGRTWINNLYH